MSLETSDRLFMVLLISGFIGLLIAGYFSVPALLASAEREEQARHERLYLTKLRIVRRFYTELQTLSYCEIAEQYDIESLYDNIGRGRHRRFI